MEVIKNIGQFWYTTQLIRPKKSAQNAKIVINGPKHAKISRSLCSKVHQLEKITPLLVVAVVTNISYDYAFDVKN